MKRIFLAAILVAWTTLAISGAANGREQVSAVRLLGRGLAL
jgi:hypothetical protein